MRNHNHIQIGTTHRHPSTTGTEVVSLVVRSSFDAPCSFHCHVPSKRAIQGSSIMAMKDDQDQEKYCISLEDVKKAAQNIKGMAHRTPLLTSASFNHHGHTHKTFFFKVEAMQRTGSFKFRGAMNAVSIELAATLGPLSVVTHSSGNHAQALALAAKMSSSEHRPVDATIVMPRNAPEIKQAAVRGYNAKIILVDNTNEAREEEADRLVRDTGAIFIHPSEDPRVIAGQGTASLEIIQQLDEMGYQNLDAVIIPVGGGGLAAGNTIALRGMLGDKVKVG